MKMRNMGPRLSQIVVILVVALLSVSASLVGAADPPQPTYVPPGSTAVDGDPGEWNLDVDYFADLYKDANPAEPVLSHLYLRYDCAAGMLYALVLVNPSLAADPPLTMDTSSAQSHKISWMSQLLVDGTSYPQDGQPPDLAWIVDENDAVIGWEASFLFPEGTYTAFDVQVRVWYDGVSTLAKNCCLDLVLECAELGRLDGHKFLDLNGNGVWDQPAEPPLAGWEIALSNGSVTTTDENGYYAFEDLPYGDYTVSESCPGAWAQTAPGFTDLDTCGTMIHTAELTLEVPEVNNLDFGNGQPEIDLVKGCPADVFAGDVISYTLTVTNTGNVALQGIDVSDPTLGITETVDLGPGESQTFFAYLDSLPYAPLPPLPECPEVGNLRVFLPLVVFGGSTQPVRAPSVAPTLPLAEVITNTATATGEYALATVTDSDSCVTTIHQLQVRKDARPSYTRQYFWTLDKTVDDPGPITLLAGAMTTPHYTVTVDLANPPYVDSGWAVEGIITVENPAPINAPLASVVDTMCPDLAVDVNCESLIVPAGGSLECTYGPVQLPDAANRTNLAVATLSNNNGRTTAYGATAVVDFSQPDVQLIDAEVEVSDQFSDQPGELLGTVRYDEVPVTFGYNRTIQAVGDPCELFEVPNVATLVTNDSGTTILDEAAVQILELCELAAAYEDLLFGDEGLDWDYNDWVATIGLDPTFAATTNDGGLLRLDFTVVPEARGAALDHEFHLLFPANTFACDGQSTLTLFDADNGGGPLPGYPVTQAFDASAPNDFTVIAPTSAALPPMSNTDERFDLFPYVPTALTAVLSIEFPQACPFNPSEFQPETEAAVHGEGLFFEPYLHVLRKTIPAYDVGAGDVRMVIIPANWMWPEERVPVWEAYLSVKPSPVPAEPANPPTFEALWWTGERTTEVYDKPVR